MSKGKSIATTSIASVHHVPNRDNVAWISVITSHKQFRHFANVVTPLFGDAKIVKYLGKDAPITLSSRDLFVYPIAFMVGFKLSIHPIAAELLRQLNDLSHRVVPNAWRILAAVLTLNALLNLEL